MPLPLLVSLAIASGSAAAFASRAALRVSPRPALLTQACVAYALFLLLLLVPASVYFYAFHGDWAVLYLLDVRRVPSAVALLAFVLQAALGVGAFAAGSALVRAQRDSAALVIAGAALCGGLAALILGADRLAVVGTYAQYHGAFGLSSFAQSGALLQASLAMGALLLVGLAYLLARLHLAARRV